jgi:hypothetical protein
MSDFEKAAIAPDAKLAAVLESYPLLESVVAELIPDFGKLAGASLRLIAARTLTLEQAAASANIPAPQFIIQLRKAAGMPETSAQVNLSNAPDWVKNAQIAETLDARPMLAQGQHPKAIVEQKFSALQTGQVFLLITPFVPGPLIELGRANRLLTWTRQGEAGKFETYFGKP